MKTYLKPAALKIILTFALFALSSYVWRMYIVSTISDTFPWGFPLQYYLAWGPCPQEEVCSTTNVFYFILDIVFWYLISAFAVARFTEKVKATTD